MIYIQWLNDFSRIQYVGQVSKTRFFVTFVDEYLSLNVASYYLTATKNWRKKHIICKAFKIGFEVQCFAEP